MDGISRAWAAATAGICAVIIIGIAATTNSWDTAFPLGTILPTAVLAIIAIHNIGARPDSRTDDPHNPEHRE